MRRVAEAASKAGDIRVGFSILLTAGYLAERDGRGKIGLDDLETAAKFLDFAKGLHNGSKSLEEE